MKKPLILLFAIILSASLIESKKKKKKDKEISDNLNIDDKGGDDNKMTAEDGIYMSEEKFDEKLKEVLKKRNLNSKKKITKDVLKQIFNEIYEKDLDVPDLPEDEEQRKEALAQGKKFMDDIFSNVARGLDYDDKIKVKDIKYWINPKRAQESLTEVMKKLEEMMGEL